VTETVIRVAARGEGVTANGRFVPMSAPGDGVSSDGIVTPGPHHQVPPCRHFPECGGCQLQHVDDSAYADFLKDRIASSLAAQGLSAPDILEPHLSPPRSRRRAALKAQGGAVGFNAEASHRIVDMRECHVLRPELFALVAPLRRMLKSRAAIVMTLADQGVDLLLEGVKVEGLEATEAMIAFAQANDLARLALDDGFGPQTIWEPEPVTITLSGIPVALPIGAFLQATAEGEAVLVAAMREAVGGATLVADLFAGLGTFALALSAKVYAAEGARDAALALKAAGAGRGIFADHRDLFRRPLDVAELNRFEAVILDPPRAGAKEQAPNLAACLVPRLAYLSCNPNTFARDAKLLIEGGYRLLWVRPVGQFRWSTHVELAAAFGRD
jgi:23S rRNA (uracil1939-C5)-methyltransferase